MLRTITRERLLELADATGDPDRRDLYLDLAGRWKHNWIPLDAIAAAIKAKRMKGDGKRRPRAEWATPSAKSAGSLPTARGGGKSRLDPKGAAAHTSGAVLGGGRAKAGPARPNAGTAKLAREAYIGDKPQRQWMREATPPRPAPPKPRKESALLAEWRQLRAEQMQRFENPTARGGRPEEHADYFGTGENMGHNAQEKPLTYRAFLESKSREKQSEKAAGDAHKAGVALGLKHSQAAKLGPEHDAELEALMNDHGRNEHLVAGGYADGQMLGEARAQAAAQRKAAAAEKRRGESAARKAEKDAQGAANRARTSENPRVIAAAGEAHRAAAHAHLAIGNDDAGVRHTEAAQAYLERARKLEEGQRRLEALGKRSTPAAPTGTLEAARPSVGDRVTIHNVGVTGDRSARYVGDDVNGKPKVEYSSGGQLVRTSIRPDQMTRQEQPASAPSPARLAEQVGTSERDASLNPQAAQALAAHNLKVGARVTYSSRQPAPGGGANVVVPQRGEWEITGLARNGQVRIRDTQHGSYVDAEPGLLKPAGKATAPTAAGATPDFRSLSMEDLQRHVRLGNKWASQANAEIGRRDDLADPTGLQRRAAGIRPHLDVSENTPPQSTAEPITVRKVGNSWLAEQDNGRNVSSVRVPHNPSLSDAENKAAARRALERSRPAPEPPARHLQSVGTPKSEAAAGGARARSLPAGDKLSGVHSETYRGERLSVRPAPGRPGYLQASINGHVVNMSIARSNADAVRQLDSLRGTVDDAHARPGNYHNGAGETSYGMKLPKPGGGDPKGEAAGKAASGAGSHITVEHSGDGTTVHGTTRADTEQQAALKAQGFRWSRNLGAWYLPRTQRESTREGKVRALEAHPAFAGATINRGDVARSGTGEDRAAARIDRARELADVHQERAVSAAQEAERRFGAAHDIGDRIPMGQPILVGHHSEARHRRDLEKIDRNMRAGVDAHASAQAAQERAASAAARARLEEDPKFAARRADRNEAELRRVNRMLEGSGREIYGTDVAATGERRQRLLAMKAELEQDVARDRAVVAEKGTGLSQSTVKPGDVVVHRGDVHVVSKANAKTVAVPHWNPPTAARGVTDKIEYHQIGQHRPAESLTTEQITRILDGGQHLDPKARARLQAIVAARKGGSTA